MADLSAACERRAVLQEWQKKILLADPHREAVVDDWMFSAAGAVEPWLSLVRNLRFWLPDDSTRTNQRKEMDALMASPDVSGVIGIGVGKNAGVSLAPVARSPHIARLERMYANSEGLPMDDADWAAVRDARSFQSLREIHVSSAFGTAADVLVALALRAAPQLEKLALTHGGVANTPLFDHLASFVMLRDLDLEFAGLSAKHLDIIAETAPASLVTLQLRGNVHWPKDAAARFRALPRWRGVTVRI